jgi:hypothetical protein
MTKFTVNVPFEKLKITEEEIAKRQELIKKHTDENGNINLYLVFKEFYEWLTEKDKQKNEFKKNSTFYMGR